MSAPLVPAGMSSWDREYMDHRQKMARWEKYRKLRALAMTRAKTSDECECGKGGQVWDQHATWCPIWGEGLVSYRGEAERRRRMTPWWPLVG